MRSTIETFRTRCRERIGAAGLVGKWTVAATLSTQLFMSPAQAQDVEARKDSLSSERPAIVVTARKTEERIQDVPTPILALTRESIERYGIDDLQAASQLAPQVTLSEGGSGNGSQIFMRGIGTSGNSAGFEQSVGVVIDGVYYGRGRWLSQAFVDMERIEVLKGPQTLYFGKNTPAGVVSVTTANPTEDWMAYVRAGYELRADEIGGEAVVSGPISDTLGFRLAGQISTMKGWVKAQALPRSGADPLGLVLPGRGDRRLPGTEEQSARVTLKWDPSPEFSAVIKGQISGHTDTGSESKYELLACEGPGGTAQTVFGVSDPFDDCTPNFKNSLGDAPPELTSDFPEFRGGELFSEYDSKSLSVTLNYDAGSLNFSSTSGYNKYKNEFFDNFDFSAAAQVFAYETEEFETFSQEFRVRSDFNHAFDFVAGAYYDTSTLNFRNASRVAPVPADPQTGRYWSWDRLGKQEQESWSVFGEVILRATDTIRLNAGARYTEATKDDSIGHIYVHPFLLGVFSPPSQVITNKFETTDFSPEITLSWRPNSNINLYGSYKEGFKAGGFNQSGNLLSGTDVDDLTFGDESIEGWEFGVKLSLLGNSLRIDASAYSYVYSDLQVNFVDPVTVAQLVRNAAKADVRGMEATLDWRAARGFDVRAAVAYNKARYDDFIGPCYAGQTIEAGCSLNVSPVNGRATAQELTGKRLPIAADWNANIGFSLEQPISSGLQFSVALDGRYSSGYTLSALNKPAARQSGYATVDGSIRLFATDDRWEFALIGRNLLDEAIALSGGDRPLTGGASGISAATPGSGILADTFGVLQRSREIKLQATYRFQ